MPRDDLGIGKEVPDDLAPQYRADIARYVALDQRSYYLLVRNRCSELDGDQQEGWNGLAEINRRGDLGR